MSLQGSAKRNLLPGESAPLSSNADEEVYQDELGNHNQMLIRECGVFSMMDGSVPPHGIDTGLFRGDHEDVIFREQALRDL